MGEYFKDEKPKEKLAQEVTLITDFNVLCSTFTILVNKIEETTSQGYEAILPIRHELSGGGRGPDDTGQIGELRKIDVQGKSKFLLFSTLDNVEKLDRWSEKQLTYLEDHINRLKVIVDNLLEIINLQNRKIGEKVITLEGANLNQKNSKKEGDKK